MIQLARRLIAPAAILTVVLALAVPANAVILVDPYGVDATDVYDNIGSDQYTGSFASPWYPGGSPGEGLSIGHHNVSLTGPGEILVNGGDDIINRGTNNYVGKEIGSNGTVTLDGAGSSWNMDYGSTGHLYVGQFGTGEVTVSGGADLFAEKVRIGYSDMHDRTGVGTVTVTGNGSTMDDDSKLMVGYYGQGTLIVGDEGKVTSGSIDAGYQWNSQGSITVSGGDTDGNGTPSYLSGTHAIGLYGTGSLIIDTGAYAEGNNSYVGRYPDTGGGASVGTVSIGNDGGGTGLEAEWYIYNRLYIGAKNTSEAGGIGEVTVEEEGRLDVQDTIYIGPRHADSGGGGAPVLYRGGLTLSGGTVVADAIEIIEPEALPSPLIIEGGTLSVTSLTGNLELTAGTFAPGSSPATATITGNYVQGASGTLLMELGGETAGTQYDQLQISGLLDLDGVLSVQLIDGFTPALGNTFDLLDWGSQTGSFATMTLPDLSSDGLNWDTGSLLIDGTVSVISIPEDLNMDGMVDSLDLGILLEAYGTVGTPSTGELNGTSPVDSLDLGILLAAFNTSASGAATAAVPEPHTLLLASLASIGLTLRRRRSAR
ncbi:MAG: PEP-CTERM sorting domain-containing protein [Pirellulales bacterium]|nr:PEP-CTERM sorting domain-containing protein [Pirellulales bacterium]